MGFRSFFGSTSREKRNAGRSLSGYNKRDKRAFRRAANKARYGRSSYNH